MYRGLILGLFLGAACAAASAPVTFTKDVLPVLQKNCQSCHRPGEATPMSLMTYQDARPWAKAMREAVLLKRMPPWFADPAHGKFLNDRALSRTEIDTLVAWAEAGAPEGDPKDRPAPRTFVEGWNIGAPDQTFEMPIDFGVPARGTIEYTYFVVPTGFTADKWIQRAEVRPGNRAVVHHVIAYVRPPDSKWLREAKPGVPFVPQKGDNDGGEGRREFLIGYAPGTVPEALQPGQAKLVKAGSDIVFQMHYTTNGQAAEDRSRVGLVFANQPREQVVTIATQNRKFVIPAGAANHEVEAQLTLYGDATLTALFPHMHLRGKSFEYRVVYPTGESEVLLNVPRYDFNWQLSYYLQQPKLLTKGTRIECTAHFDNSANNPANPNPKEDVKWGDQSWEEMMIGFMDVSFPVGQDIETILRDPKRKRN
jgi:hypothetical protein